MVDTVFYPITVAFDWLPSVWSEDSWIATAKNIIHSVGHGVFEIFESNFVKKRRAMGNRGLDFN